MRWNRPHQICLADGVVHLALLAEPLLPRTSSAIKVAFGIVGRGPSGALAEGGYRTSTTIQRAFGVTDRQPPTPAVPIMPACPAKPWRSGVRPTDPPVLFPRV